MGPVSLSTPLLLFLLPVLLSLCGQVNCGDSCVQTLPNASDIQALAVDNQNQLLARLQEVRIFPSITFNCSGSIVGWRVAAIRDTRGGRPELSVWRPDGTNGYIKMAASNVNSCVIIDNVTTLDNTPVMIHQYIVDTPIRFEPGYVLGILLRPRPEYIPLLYNNTEGLESFYKRRQGSPELDVITTNDNRDTLLPLISLETCVANSSCSSVSTPICLTPISPTSSSSSTTSSPTSSTTASSSPTSSTTASSSPTSSLPTPVNEPLSVETLIIAIAVPACVVMVILLAIIVTLLCCKCRNRELSKHSNNFTDHSMSCTTGTTVVATSIIRNSSETYHPYDEIPGDRLEDLYDEIVPMTRVISTITDEKLQDSADDRQPTAIVTKQSSYDDSGDIEMKRNEVYGQLPQQQVVKNPSYNWWNPS